MAAFTRAGEQVRAVVRLQPGRPAVGLGLRAAAATFVPLAAANYFHLPALRWSLVAGFMVALVDKGGAYRTRAVAMAWLTGAGAFAVVAASVVPAAAAPTAAVMFVVAAMASVSRVYGPEASSAGTSATILCAIALDGAGASLEEALVRGALVVAGGAWAMTLSLVLWPVRVYRPARLAVARCFRDLADHAADIERHLDDPGSESWQADVVKARGKIRDSVEAARSILAGTRRGARGESGRGARLLVLFHVADQIFARMGALGEVLEAAHTTGGSPEVRDVVRKELEALRASLDETAMRIESEARVEPLAARVIHEDDLRASGPDYAHAATLLVEIAAFTDTAAEITATLHDDRAPRSVPGLPTTLDLAPTGSRLDPLRDAFAPESVVWRHALRVAVVASIAVALTHLFTLPRGYWVTITAIAVLQPHMPETFLKATQRIAGTVAGAAVAAVVAATLHDPRGIMLLTLVLATVSVSVIQLNYALFSFFLTPTFVLLAELSAGDWTLAKWRVLNTLLGGALALVGARIFLPSRERDRFPRQMADALRALRGLVVAAMSDGVVDEARRASGVAFNNAEASFNRLLAESRGELAGVEPRMTLLLYARRISSALLALAATESPSRRVSLGVIARVASSTLDTLAVALEAETRPAPTAAIDWESIGEPSLRLRVERIAAQISVLEQAASRLYGAPSGAPTPQPREAPPLPTPR
jgi:uncharacterized membrane protein YccC